MIESSAWLGRDAVAVDNQEGRGPFVLVCDHASNWVPPALQGLGLTAVELARHIAWDPGALDLARRLSAHLDAPLVHAAVSRLVLDVNRDPGHPGSIVTQSEDTVIPANKGLAPAERARRVSAIYEPYHRVLAAVVAQSINDHGTPIVVSVHSFTPVYRQERRPWHIGVLSNDDRRIADPLLQALRADEQLVVGDNQPYAPSDGVYHTLTRHCAERTLRSVLLELRSDLLAEAPGQDRWAQRLAQALQAIH